MKRGLYMLAVWRGANESKAISRLSNIAPETKNEGT